MAFIPVPNVAQVELVANWDNQVVETVLHYQAPAAMDGAVLSRLANTAIATWAASVRPLCANNLTLFQCKVTDLTTANSPSVTVAATGSMTGTQSTPSLPNNVALCLTKRTFLRGRSFRGRIYHYALPEAQVTGNAVAGAFVTTVLAGWSALLTLVNADGNWEMVVVSRFTDDNPRSAGIFTPVSDLTSDGIIDSNRRRLPGRGS